MNTESPPPPPDTLKRKRSRSLSPQPKVVIVLDDDPEKDDAEENNNNHLSISSPTKRPRGEAVTVTNSSSSSSNEKLRHLLERVRDSRSDCSSLDDEDTSQQQITATTVLKNVPGAFLNIAIPADDVIVSGRASSYILRVLFLGSHIALVAMDRLRKRILALDHGIVIYPATLSNNSLEAIVHMWRMCNKRDDTELPSFDVMAWLLLLTDTGTNQSLPEHLYLDDYTKRVDAYLKTL